MGEAMVSNALLSKLMLLFLALCPLVPITLRLSSTVPILRIDNHPIVINCPESTCRKIEQSGHLYARNLTQPKEKQPIDFSKKELRGKKIALVNFERENDDHIKRWENLGETTVVRFDVVPENLEWKQLFPEWIDEDEERQIPECPEIPMPNFGDYGEFDAVVSRLPCSYPKEGWARDVFRLQVHLVSGNLAVRNGRKNGDTVVAFLSSCRPMIEIFRCDDLVKREGDWWIFKPDLKRLRQKVVSLPVGSCKLAVPLVKQDEKFKYDFSMLENPIKSPREAYATVLHSSESYVCGAIALAQSIKNTNSTKDLVLLADKSIKSKTLQALEASGWKVRLINRIRSPNAKKNAYNEWNYSKLRLWQLTDYDKIMFIDSDLIVLKNLDMFFRLPQLSAAGNNDVLFNSGVMLMEPSDCTFQLLVQQTKEIISYNGGDQGFLNEIFTWWHRCPKKMNYLKFFRTRPTGFRPIPPGAYAIHYLGMKPWTCYRDYDCNWDREGVEMFGSDDFHKRWWELYDSMPERLHGFCALSRKRNLKLMELKEAARDASFVNGHWRIKVTDPRQYVLSD